MTYPVFLLAPPRSFTTVVTAMLGNHSKMFGMAETNLFAGDSLGDLLRLYNRTGRLAHGLLRSVAELGFGGQSEEDIEAVWTWLNDNQDMLTAEIFDGLRNWAGDRALLDKSPIHVTSISNLKRIGHAVEDARFIHMTRHPLAVFESAVRLREAIRGAGMAQAFAGDLTPDSAWLKPNMTILDFLRTIPPERQIRIKGEDLMAEPRLYLPQICEWLKLDTSKDDVEDMLHPERSPFAVIGPSNARFGNDPSFMKNPELREFTDTLPPVTEINREVYGVDFGRDILHHAQLFGY